MLQFGLLACPLPGHRPMETTGALAAAAPLYSSALDGAFGLQDVGSAASLEGSVRQLPFAPLPLPHALPSGLSRPQVRTEAKGTAPTSLRCVCQGSQDASFLWFDASCAPTRSNCTCSSASSTFPQVQASTARLAASSSTECLPRGARLHGGSPPRRACVLKPRGIARTHEKGSPTAHSSSRDCMERR